jgi:hypothetical protein
VPRQFQGPPHASPPGPANRERRYNYLRASPGESPALGGSGPPEIGVVVPNDFVAIPAGQPFGRIAPSLAVEALAAHGPILLAVKAPRR